MGRTVSQNVSGRFTQEFLALNDQRQPLLRLIRNRPTQFLSIDAGELSDLSGVDVAFPWRRMDQRQPIGLALNFPERDIVDAFASEFEGNGGSSVMFPITAPPGHAHIESGVVFDAGNSLLRLGTDLHPFVFDAEGWADYFANGNGFVEYLSVANRTTERMTIIGIDTVNLTNDALKLLPGLRDEVGIAYGDWVRVVSVRNFDRRGIFMSNGRRVFQFQSNLNSELLRVPEGSIGDRVRGAGISNNRFMFVSPNYATRLVTLANEDNNMPHLAFSGATYNDTTHEITKTGRFQFYVDKFGVGDPDVVVILSGTEVTPGVYPITGAPGNNTLEFGRSLGVGGVTADVSGYILRRSDVEHRLAGPLPPFGLGRRPLGPNDAVLMALETGGNLTKGSAAVRLRVFDLDTNSASAFYQCKATDVLGDGSDEIEIVVDEDSTYKLQVKIQRRAARDQFLALDRRSHVLQFFRKLSAGATYHMELEVPIGNVIDTNSQHQYALILDDTDLRNKPVLPTAEAIKGLPPACRDIAILGQTGTVILAGKADIDNFKHPIIDGLTFKWPTIDNDNVIHVSRTDSTEPENFPPRVTNQISISKLGDKFQRFATAGNVVVAVMSRGVYTFRSGGEFGVIRSVVAETGLGTPWPDSVISVERFAFWVTSSNAYLFNPDEEDFSEQLLPIARTISEWLRDAFDGGDDIQSAFDQRRRVIVVRRITDKNTVQDWEYHIPTGNTTFVDDRTAKFYVAATAVNVSAASSDQAILYSVDQSGQVHEIGKKLNPGDALNYDSGTIQSLLTAYTVDDEAISQAISFPLSTLGDSIRFRSTNPAVDGQVRKLSSLTNAGVTLTLDDDANVNRLALVFPNRHLGLVVWADTQASPKYRYQPVSFVANSALVAKGSLATGTSTSGSGTKSIAATAVSNREVWVLRDGFNGVAIARITLHEDPVALNAHIIERESLGGSASSIDLGNFIDQAAGVVVIGVRKVLAAWSRTVTQNLRVAVIARDTEGSFSNGNTLNLGGGDAHDLIALGDDRALVTYRSTGNADIRARVCDVSGLTVTSTVEFVISSLDAGGYASRLGRIDDNNSIVCYRSSADGVEVGIISTTAVSGVVAVSSNAAHRIYKVLMLSATKGVLCWHDSTDNHVKLQGFKVAGSTITMGAAAINLLSVANATTHAVDMAAVDANNFLVAYRDPADSDLVKIVDGLIYDSTNTVTVSNFGLRGVQNGVTFDAVPGLAVGDEFMIGAVPLRMKFAPITGDRTRNMKRLDGVSVWAKPAGRTVTTTKKMQVHAYRNLSTAREKLDYDLATELNVPILAPSEVSAQDENKFVTLSVEGKTIELELENLDADTGIELVNVAGIVKETGDLTEDRDATA